MFSQLISLWFHIIQGTKDPCQMHHLLKQFVTLLQRTTLGCDLRPISYLNSAVPILKLL
jgi:hypothetical protein